MPTPSTANHTLSPHIRPHPSQDQTRVEPWQTTDGWPVIANDKATTFRIGLANNLSLRTKALGLAYQIYRQKRFTTAQTSPWIFKSYDQRPETVIFYVMDEHGHFVGTVTLAFDSEQGLPFDSCTQDLSKTLRRNGKRLVEVTRFAILDRPRQPREVFLSLMNFTFIYAKTICQYDTFLIEVHPRHAAFYQRLLGFKALSQPYPCPHAEGAQAILLGLDLNIYEEYIHHPTCPSNEDLPANRPLLYDKFLPSALEADAAQFLRKSFTPITDEECAFFLNSNHVERESIIEERRHADK